MSVYFATTVKFGYNKFQWPYKISLLSALFIILITNFVICITKFAMKSDDAVAGVY